MPLRAPLLLIIANFFAAGCNITSCQPEACRCEQISASAAPELVQRATELLDLFRVDRQRFRNETTTEFRPTLTDEAMAPVAVPLSEARDARAVWRVRDAIGSARGHTCLCRVEAPYADTFIVGAESEAAIVFFETERPRVTRQLSVGLSRVDGRWLLHGLAAHPWRDRGRTAEDFERLGSAREESGDILGALFAYHAAHLLSRSAPRVQTIVGGRVTAKLQRLNASEQLAAFTSRSKIPREHDHLGFAVVVTEDEGLMPLINFVSSAPLEATEPEARALFRAVTNVAPTLETDFSTIAMRAYSEPPLPDRQHPTFGTLIKMRGPKE